VIRPCRPILAELQLSRSNLLRYIRRPFLSLWHAVVGPFVPLTRDQAPSGNRRRGKATRPSNFVLRCPSSFSTELPSVGHWSWLWPEERAKKFPGLPALVCFSRGLGSRPAFFTTLCCRRWSWCWRAHRRHGWRGSQFRRRGGWQFHGRRCSDNWRFYSRRPILASWLVCETLGNSRDNCDSYRNHSNSNCPACEALSLPMLGIAMP
jgi:hypothetical protein